MLLSGCSATINKRVSALRHSTGMASITIIEECYTILSSGIFNSISSVVQKLLTVETSQTQVFQAVFAAEMYYPFSPRSFNHSCQISLKNERASLVSKQYTKFLFVCAESRKGYRMQTAVAAYPM